MPKYAGFVPGVKAENLFGKTNTELSRQAFRKEILDAKPNFLATTGYFNIDYVLALIVKS